MHITANGGVMGVWVIKGLRSTMVIFFSHGDIGNLKGVLQTARELIPSNTNA